MLSKIPDSTPPTMKQYFEFHQKYTSLFPGDSIAILMQVGSFYELYQTDSPELGPKLSDICKILDISKTRKDKNSAVSGKPATTKNPHMAGFVMQSFDKFAPLLLDQHYTVIKVDQVTSKPNIKREVVEILSGSTAMLSSNIHSPELITFTIEKNRAGIISAGISKLDLSTGKSGICELNGLDTINSWINTCTPKEVILYADNSELFNFFICHPKFANISIHKRQIIHKEKKLHYYNHALSHFYTNTGVITPVEFLGLTMYHSAIHSWIKSLEFVKLHNPRLLHIPIMPSVIIPEKYLWLDRNALFDLNIVPTNLSIAGTNNRKINGNQTLIEQLDHTVTCMGKRLLRERLVKPIRNKNELNRRYDMIDFFIKNKLYKNVRQHLSGILDIERMHRSWSIGTIMPSKWCRLIESYEKIIETCDILKTKESIHIRKNVKNILDFHQQTFDINRMKNINIWSDLNDTFIFKGVCSELDKIQEECDQIQNKVDDLIKRTSTLFGAPVYFKKTDRDGWMLRTTPKRYKDISKKHPELMKDWIIRKTGNQVAMVPPELKKGNQRFDYLKGPLRSITREKYREYLDQQFINNLSLSENLEEIVKNISEWDFSQSCAWSADIMKHYRPNILDVSEKNAGKIEASKIRNIIVENIQQNETFIPNDICLGFPDKPNGLCIFAPNAAGKSTLMASVGHAIVMAQAGMHVACDKLSFTLMDGIYTRINAHESVGVSSFVSEMIQLRNIIKKSTSFSLVLSDEACNMTETTSALSISASTLNHLVKKNTCFLFATHLHTLTELSEVQKLQPKLGFKHLRVDINDGEFSYIRTLEDGAGESVYGLTVAKQIINDPDFLNYAGLIQKKIMGAPDSRQSKYNAQMWIRYCDICEEPATEVHHIKHQVDAIENYHSTQHKNHRSNLVALCEFCHNQVHRGKIEIKCWRKTTAGTKLIWNTPK